MIISQTGDGGWSVTDDAWGEDGLHSISARVGSLAEAVTVEHEWLVRRLSVARWSGRAFELSTRADRLRRTLT